MFYIAQDLNDRMWLVDGEHIDRFMAVAGREANQDILDDLAIHKDEEVALLEFLDSENDGMWSLNSADEDFPIAFRPCPNRAVDALMLDPINPAEMALLV